MPTTIVPASERSTAAGNASAADSRLEIDATRPRQTERAPAPFRDVLAGGVSLLMSGAEVATHIVAGPVMAAAVHDARIGAVSSPLRRRRNDRRRRPGRDRRDADRAGWGHPRRRAGPDSPT